MVYGNINYGRSTPSAKTPNMQTTHPLYCNTHGGLRIGHTARYLLLELTAS